MITPEPPAVHPPTRRALPARRPPIPAARSRRPSARCPPIPAAQPRRPLDWVPANSRRAVRRLSARRPAVPAAWSDGPPVRRPTAPAAWSRRPLDSRPARVRGSSSHALTKRILKICYKIVNNSPEAGRSAPGGIPLHAHLVSCPPFHACQARLSTLRLPRPTVPMPLFCHHRNTLAVTAMWAATAMWQRGCQDNRNVTLRWQAAPPGRPR
jgi:hypothetical protein